MEEIWGYIEHIVFQNPENGFVVAKLKEPKKSELTSIVGCFPLLNPGETVRCQGTWKVNAQHGFQFEVINCQSEAPADLLGIQKYLESGLIKGIGPVYAKRIVDRFGTETLAVIDQQPEKLSGVDGLGPKRIEKIQSCWQNQKAIRQVMIFLQQFGVSPAYAQKIFKRYGDSSIEKVKANPYALAEDIHGIGFKTADTIASKMGIPQDSPFRIAAGICNLLSEFSTEGHICYPETALIPAAEALLEVPASAVQESLNQLEKEDKIIRQLLEEEGESKSFIWLKLFYLCEVGIVRELDRLQRAPSFLRSIQIQPALEWVQKQLQIELASSQQEAVAQSAQNKFQIITGGPGTGKSTITRAILTILGKLTSKIILAAPTGRAAKRLSEITKREAKTIHSLLEWGINKGGFKRNRENPLECDLIVIDEASMIDTLLMYSLLKAIPSHARVILVGDINQLPSVGPGNVLKDIIQSTKVPVITLTEVFRQAQGSKIVTNAHLINQGLFPDVRGGSDSDFFFIKAEEPEVILTTILDLVQRRLPWRYRLHPINDIQILTPMKKGPIGTERLNLILQEKLNPSETPLFQSGRRFHKGDKVMQIRNNYQKEVYNGDIGRVATIDLQELELIVNYDGRFVTYDLNELDELTLAYAVSVHKYQGSECPCVIMPIHTCHFILLHRNLLYTGVTRGKRLVVLVGTGKAMHIAIQNDEVKCRYTGLQHGLKQLP